MSELKPCPFCGGSNLEEDWESAVQTKEGLKQTGWVNCLKCDASVSYTVNESNMDWCTGGHKLHSKWNARADSLVKREAIEELLTLHDKDREKVNSQCKTLINRSTVDKYLRSLGQWLNGSVVVRYTKKMTALAMYVLVTLAHQ